MSDFFAKIRDKFLGSGKESDYDEVEEDYVEIDTAKDKGRSSKIIVRPFSIEDFSDIKPALDALREGTTIALINIKPLKEKDIVELKRAVNKIKKTCAEIAGDIAGFGEDWIVVTPSFAKVDRSTTPEDIKENPEIKEDF